MWGRSGRGKRIEPTGKFSPAARAATSATSIPQAYESHVVESRSVSEGETTPGPTSGLRKDPVAGLRRENGTVVLSLAGELDLYNAGDVREALLAACAEEPQRLV